MGVPIDDNIVISGETKFMPDNPSSGGFDPDSLSASTTTPTDNDEIITKESSTWVRKAFSKVWDYIKVKLPIRLYIDSNGYISAEYDE